MTIVLVREFGRRRAFWRAGRLKIMILESEDVDRSVERDWLYRERSYFRRMVAFGLGVCLYIYLLL